MYTLYFYLVLFQTVAFVNKILAQASQNLITTLILIKEKASGVHSECIVFAD